MTSLCQIHPSIHLPNKIVNKVSPYIHQQFTSAVRPTISEVARSTARRPRQRPVVQSLQKFHSFPQTKENTLFVLHTVGASVQFSIHIFSRGYSILDDA